MRLMILALEKLAVGMNLLAALAAVLMSFFVFLGVLMRYVVGSPFMFSDELTGLLFVSMAFLAMPLGLVLRRHINVDMVTRTLSGRLRHLSDMAAAVIVTAFGVWFAWESYGFAAMSHMLDSRSDVGSLLLWPWMALLPACTVIVILVALGQCVDSARQLFGQPSLFTLSAEEEVQ